VSVQAAKAQVLAAADQNIDVASTSDAVTVGAPEHVLLTAGGSALQIEKGAIMITTGSPAKFLAAIKSLDGAGSASLAPVRFGQSAIAATKHYLQFVARDSAGQPLANKPYVLLMADGTLRPGTTDGQGQTEQVTTDWPEAVQVYIEDAEHEGYYVT
jgi:uncharacterized protein (DUF2345 family)